MRSLTGFVRTGRIQRGPGSDLVEMTGADGRRHTAIEFHEEYRSHNAINAALGVVLSFLESPLVSGLTDLGAYDLGQSTFVYPTGQTWSVAEVVRTLADMGDVGGVRAGVELLAEAGQILVEAAETGESAGVYSHGGLTPWRVMLGADGAVQIIGHALPQVEILTFHEQPDRVPREDAFRYCPPERLESKRENFSSDLFGLGLVAFEVMCGKPVYDGLVNDIRAKAARGETSRRIHQFRELLPESVRALLTTVLRPDFRDRFGSGGDYFDAVNAALGDPAVQGAGLRELMQRVARQQPRARQDLDPAKTSMLSKDALKSMMDVEPAPPKAQRAAFAPAPRRPDAASAPAPASSRPTPPPAAEPAASANAPRAGLPPARRPPPRAADEELSGASASPAAAAPVSVATPPPVPPAPPPDAPRVGPPLRAGARPNPRASASVEAAGPSAVAAPPVATPRVVAPVPPPEAPAGDPPRPAVGVARLPPSRRPPASPDPDPPPAAGPPVASRPPVRTSSPDAGRLPPDAGRPVPPPPVVSSGDRAKDLLARVRASGNSDAFVRPTPSASAVLDRILTSSGNGLRERVALAVEASRTSGDDDLARRAPPAPPPAPPAAAPAPPVAPRAAAPAEPARPPPPPPVAAPPPPRASAAGSPAPSPVPVAAPAQPPPAPPPAATALPPSAPAAPRAPDSPTANRPTPPPSSSVGARTRSPDALKSGLRGDPIPYRLARAPGVPAQRRRIPAGSSLADVAAYLVGQVVPVRTGLDGRLLGWWRLGPTEGPLPADTLLDTLDPEGTLVFHFVESRVLTLDLEVHSGESVLRLRAPVGTAVPVASLVDAIAALAGLGPGDWALALDGATLEPAHILDDRSPTPASVLTVRRA